MESSENGSSRLDRGGELLNSRCFAKSSWMRGKSIVFCTIAF